MVYFVCEHCSETLKRKACDTHFSCRPAKLTCVDCSKTFHGDAYKEHTSCISEEEKYQKTLYKGGGKVKRDPQAEWTEAVHNAAATATKHKDLMERLTNYSNVPRKLKPFINFAKNSIKVWNEKLLEELFAMIQAALPPKPAQQHGGSKQDDSEKETADEATAGTKRKRQDDDEDAGSAKKAAPAASSSSASEGAAGSSGSFDMKAFLVTALKGEDGNRLKLTRLKKKATEAAVAAGSSEDDADAAFEKRLAKLVKKGKIVADGSGKFVQLAGTAAGADAAVEDD